MTGILSVCEKIPRKQDKSLMTSDFQNHRIVLGMFCSLPRCSRYELTTSDYSLQLTLGICLYAHGKPLVWLVLVTAHFTQGINCLML